MNTFYADIHCHPHLKAYSRSYDEHGNCCENSDDARKANSIWRSDRPSANQNDLNTQLNLGLTKFKQADPKTLIDGGVGVVCASLYPFEKYFAKPKLPDFLADILLQCITEVGKPRINKIQAFKDYFPDLEKEYNFFLQLDGKVKSFDGKDYQYKFVNNFNELLQLHANKGTIQTLGVINTIEGGHAFGTGIHPLSLKQNKQTVLDRIEKIKTQWKYPPFFVTLAHHFYNEICGHAESLTSLAKSFNDQLEGMETGFTEEGKEILDLLVDETTGKRVFIDVKHMSVLSRRQFYEFNRALYNNELPVIVSHGGVTGLADNIGGTDFTSVVPGAGKLFNQSNINFYDVELVKVADSEGIFGIQLDERRIASKKELRTARNKPTQQYPRIYAGLVWQQIRHIALVLDHNGRFGWDIQSLGTDFDGFVDPINGFWTAEHFKNLDKLVLEHAKKFMSGEGKNMQVQQNKSIAAEEIVSRFMGQNVMEFLQQWFK